MKRERERERERERDLTRPLRFTGIKATSGTDSTWAFTGPAPESQTHVEEIMAHRVNLSWYQKLAHVGPCSVNKAPSKVQIHPRQAQETRTVFSSLIYP